LVKEALETLKRLSGDRSTDIRDAVEIAVKSWAAAFHAVKPEPPPAEQMPQTQAGDQSG
jgi:hypothetical protein